MLRGTKMSEKAKEKMRLIKIGKNNPRWNDGNSEYPNHAEFKRARIEILKRSKGKCEICGKPAKIVHHIDGNKNNHNLSNLIAVCFECHEALHCDNNGKSIRGRPTKYKLAFGISQKEMAKMFDVTTATICNWIKNPKKKLWLENELKKVIKI